MSDDSLRKTIETYIDNLISDKQTKESTDKNKTKTYFSYTSKVPLAKQLSSSGESESYKYAVKKLETPVITRYLGTGETLTITILGFIAIFLLFIITILVCTKEIESLKIIVPALTTIIGYVAGRKI